MIRQCTKLRAVLMIAGCAAIHAAGDLSEDAAAASYAAAHDGSVLEHFLDEVRIENDGEWFRLAIPVTAPWANWTLSDPPRIVLDIGQTTSRLAKAPGLFQVRLDRGPVAVLRTSQFTDELLDRRVRITLELSRMVSHEVRRVGGEITLMIPDPVERTPAALVLGPSGIGAAVMEGGGQDRPPEDRSDTSSDPGPPPQPAATLREALESILASGGVEPQGGTGPDMTQKELTGRPADGGVDPATDEEAESGASSSADGEAAPLPEAPETAGREPAAPLPARAGHREPTVESRPLPDDSGREWTLVGADLPPTTLPAEAREQGASRLLRTGLDALVRGGRPDRAEEALGRAHRFYGDTDSGKQAGILRRELLVLLGRGDEAGDLQPLPAAPDTSFIPGAAYLALVREYANTEKPAELERLLRAWGPSYGPILETAELHLSLGEAFMHAGRLDLAEFHFGRIPREDPSSARGLLLLARAGEAAGDMAGALDLYRRAAQTASGPYRARALARTADLEFQFGRVTAALQGYTRLLRSDPPADEIPWGEYQAANCNRLLGNDEAARRHYESVAENWPESFWAPFARERLDEMKRNAGPAGAPEGSGGVR